eukprot:12887392-Prorocentrum_lima.AAC.1
MHRQQDHLRQHSVLRPAPGTGPLPKAHTAGQGEEQQVQKGHKVMSPTCLLEADILLRAKFYHRV